MKKHSKTLFIIGVVAACAAVAFTAFALSHKKNKAAVLTPPTLVKLSPVEVTNIPIIATATGNLVANQQTDVSPKVGGYITQVLFHEGDFVKTGTVLITLDNSTQKNNLATAQTNEKLDQLNYQRNATLGKKSMVAQSTVDNALNTYKKDRITVRIDKKSLSDMTLRAPFSGYLGAKTVSVGDYATPGQKLVNLVDQQHLKIDYSLPNRYAPDLKLGQPVTVTADFLPNVIFHAKVSYIAPSVDPDSQTIDVHAILDNQQNQLKPGQFVNVQQVLSTQKNAILIPEGSDFVTIDSTHVLGVRDNKAVTIPITIGERLYGKVQVIKGLKKRDQIITTGQEQLKNGDPVKVISTQKAPTQ
jgi:membrane fusion protein (multidrug efflux system)